MGPIEIYTSRREFPMDVERKRIKRLVVERMDRLGAIREAVEGMLFELRA
jgi:hypothetical protein